MMLAAVSKIKDLLSFEALDVWESVNEKCKSDLKRVYNGVLNKELWSYKILDASTKIPSNLLGGNLVDLGDFDECLGVRFPDSETTGQHCRAQFSMNSIETVKNIVDMQPVFSWSYCIPSTCTPENLKDAFNNTLLQLSVQNVSVSGVICRVPGDRYLTTQDFFSIAVFGFFVLICLASTAYDVYWNGRNNPSRGILCSFSFYTNGKRLFNVGNRSDGMKCLDGLRFLTMCYIVLSHRYFFSMLSPISNLAEFSLITYGFGFDVLAGAVLSVDTFFLMSGLLNSYYLMKILDKTKYFPALTYYIHRYIRTTPALAAVIFMYATWFSQLGDGPYWNQMQQYNEEFCKKYWWPTLLYINNYYNPNEQCAGQTWYLAVDMQLYWISPLIIIPCWRWPKISKFLLPTLLLLSSAIQFVIAYLNEFRLPFSISLNGEEYIRINNLMYVPTHMRATPYIFGLMLGMFLYHQRKSNRKLSLTKMTVLAGWVTSTALCLTVILGLNPFMQPEADHPYNRLESSFYIGLHRIAWCIGLSWIIVACLYGYGGLVNSVLSWNALVPLSRLTYCIFLTQMAIQQYQIGIMRSNSYFNHFDLVHRFLGDLLAAILASVVLTLMFEMPVQAIEKYFREPKKKELTGHLNTTFVSDELPKNNRLMLGI